MRWNWSRWITKNCPSSSTRSRRWLKMRPCCARIWPVRRQVRMGHAGTTITSSCGRWATRWQPIRPSTRRRVVAEEMVYYHRTHPCPLETCGTVASMDKINGKLTVYGTFQAPACGAHRGLASVGDRRAQHPRRQPRYRWRLWQQGRGLSRLCLCHRRLDRHRTPGEMGRRPDGKPDGHGFCPRLLDERPHLGHQGWQDHRAVPAM